ncbi:hypothetical protein SAMN05421678_108160 [Actinopolymorpha cephalotaxi]|uniref:Uncharacterized protein n=1 Tax=Actinopolymorpha cephalotaxi TaxID=504797 RepID=A0A1I2UFZ0_9ACTN|nr:hypothetical protein [Actinopolymorpha cephalotaxi]SFG75980.1 hypothetical protein SAMN05421678_108160 [Actinopolymorpha cephalotaxi]
MARGQRRSGRSRLVPRRRPQMFGDQHVQTVRLPLARQAALARLDRGPPRTEDLTHAPAGTIDRAANPGVTRGPVMVVLRRGRRTVLTPGGRARFLCTCHRLAASAYRLMGIRTPSLRFVRRRPNAVRRNLPNTGWQPEGGHGPIVVTVTGGAVGLSCPVGADQERTTEVGVLTSNRETGGVVRRKGFRVGVDVRRPVGESAPWPVSRVWPDVRTVHVPVRRRPGPELSCRVNVIGSVGPVGRCTPR